MEKVLKTSAIADAYKLIANAKYQKLSDDDKLKVWKIARLIKPIAVKYEEEARDAIKALVTPDFAQKFQKLQEYAKKKASGEQDSVMTKEEYAKTAAEVLKTNHLMDEATNELDKDETLEFEPISEETLGYLMTSNDWEFSKAELLEWMVQE